MICRQASSSNLCLRYAKYQTCRPNERGLRFCKNRVWCRGRVFGLCAGDECAGDEVGSSRMAVGDAKAPIRLTMAGWWLSIHAVLSCSPVGVNTA